LYSSPNKNYWGQMKEGEIGEAYSKHGTISEFVEKLRRKF